MLAKGRTTLRRVPLEIYGGASEVTHDIAVHTCAPSVVCHRPVMPVFGSRGEPSHTSLAVAARARVESPQRLEGRVVVMV